jgi:hypothetical protein
MLFGYFQLASKKQQRANQTKRRAGVCVNDKILRTLLKGLAYFILSSWILSERAEASFCLDLFAYFFHQGKK